MIKKAFIHHEDTNDCMDAGGRAMQGAIVEDTKFLFLRVFVVNRLLN
jgi:hypothetical protein